MSAKDGGYGSYSIANGVPKAVADAGPYSVTPLHPKFGAEIRGLSLTATGGKLPEAVLRQLKADVAKYRVVVLKDQGQVPGDVQVEFSRTLGEVESTFSKHPRSPHPDIFRVSNSRAEGCTQVGRTGWHVDGTFLSMPFKYQTMHFHAVVDGGDTLFVPLKELFEMQSEDVRKRWLNLWMITGRGPVHPMVYDHPVRGDTTMCFHCGEPFSVGWLLGRPEDKDATVVEQAVVAKEITRAIETQTDLVHRMKWQLGDFAIVDNLAVAHYADEGTQLPPSQGIRILHRTTVSGDGCCERKSDGRASFVLPSR